MDAEILRQIGLSDGEIKVYFALLEIGSSKTGKISQKAGVHTSKIYGILDKLIQKGLASYIIENNVRYYQASEPKQLAEYIRQKINSMKQQEEEIQKIIPQLMLKQKLSGHKQSAAIYEGDDGIKAIFEIMLEEWKAGEDYLVLAPGDEFRNEKMNKFFLKHNLKRLEKGVIVKVIALENQKEFYKKRYANSKNMIFRFTKQSLPASINIVHNKVCTLIWEPQPTAFVIDSEDVAKKYKYFFHNLWNIPEQEKRMNHPSQIFCEYLSASFARWYHPPLKYVLHEPSRSD